MKPRRGPPGPPGAGRPSPGRFSLSRRQPSAVTGPASSGEVVRPCSHGLRPGVRQGADHHPTRYTPMRDDLLSLLPRPEFTRREFVVTSLAAGFALAVQPVSAETITTDTKGLEAGEVKIPAPGGDMPAYRAMPAEGGPFPV